MTNNIAELKSNIEHAEAFMERYGPALEKPEATRLSGGSYGPPSVSLRKQDAALLGEVFGKSGWSRKVDRYSDSPAFNWVKEVDGIVITINGAEELDMDGSPVSEKAFPILLEDSAR